MKKCGASQSGRLIASSAERAKCSPDGDIQVKANVILDQTATFSLSGDSYGGEMIVGGGTVKNAVRLKGKGRKKKATHYFAARGRNRVPPENSRSGNRKAKEEKEDVGASRRRNIAASLSSSSRGIDYDSGARRHRVVREGRLCARGEQNHRHRYLSAYVCAVNIVAHQMPFFGAEAEGWHPHRRSVVS